MNEDATELTKLPEEFEVALKDFADRMSGREDYLVVGHHDADGVTSTAIIVDLLRSLGKKVDSLNIKQLDSVSIKDIKKFGDRTLVFVDMGSGQLPIIAEHGLTDYFIVDHHKPAGASDRQINPHDHGFDGGSDVSGSGMAYLVARALGRKEKAHLAVVGAVGDMQASSGKLKSLNRFIMHEADELGLIKFKHDLSMFGRQSRALTQMLAYATDPMLPGLTGNQAACASFIEQQGISIAGSPGEQKNYVDLSWEERQKLTSALYMHLLDNNVPEFTITRMIGEVYTLLNEEPRTELRDAKEYSTVLNACGRHDRAPLAVKVCLGDRGAAWSEAKEMLALHRKELRDGLDYLAQQGLTHAESFYYFDAAGAIKESIVGVVAGMAYGARIIPPDKPVLAFAADRDDEEWLKVSARGNWALIRNGIHLGDAMNECSRAVGGEGGGHDIAAGARLPKERKQEFIKLVDEKFRAQLT